MTRTTTSKDGTTIAFDRIGEGIPIVLLGGASVDRSANRGLAELLADSFTVVNIDRRGRGDSGDSSKYSVAREVDDVAAVLEEAGGDAHLFGASSGAALAIHAAAAGVPVRSLVLWEPPYSLTGRSDLPADTPSMYRTMVAEGRRGDAVEFFMTRVVGLPQEFVAGARTAPWWKEQEALAHTLAYDAEVMGDFTIPQAAAAAVSIPTLVLAGSASPAPMQDAATQLAAMIPAAESGLLDGQGHDVDPAVLAPAVAAFVGAR